MVIPSKKLIMSLETLTGTNRFVLQEVAPVYEYVDKRRTDTIVAIRYTVANPETYKEFDVKIFTTKPIISQEMIDSIDDNIFVSFENAIVKPYKIEFGKATCSVTADSIKKL